MKLMGWLVLEDKDYFLLSNQLMGCVEEIKIRRKKYKNSHVWWATFFGFLFIL